MKLFEILDTIEDEFNSFKLILNNIASITSNHDAQTYKKIERTKILFNRKTEDFLQIDRKLNVGMVGQVKSGRSTFLNTLLFDGVNILPKAVTPKTATITRIVYSDKNFIEIEFLSRKDWKQFTLTNDFESTKEKIKEKDIKVNEFIGQENKIISVDNINDFDKILNQYIGENGMYSDFIKSVTLHIKTSGIRHLSIIDTPGLNDPISSRTRKTKDFLELCDVVFFMSHSSQFLDNTDLNLLSDILPNKGIKRLVLVGSRFDDGINDTIDDYKNINDAITKTKQSLTDNANKVFTSLVDKNRDDKNDRDLSRMYNAMKKPIFISSITHGMSKKNKEDYSENEHIVFRNLNYFKNLDNDILYKIGNFEEIQRTFKNVSRQKETMLIRKANAFIPDTKASINEFVSDGIYRTEKRIELLENFDTNALENQKNQMLEQVTFLKENLDNVFLSIFEDLDKTKLNSLVKFNKSLDKSIIMEETIHKETIKETAKDKPVKWYNPTTWKNNTSKEIVFEEEHTSLDVDKALRKIKNSAIEYKDVATNSIDSILDVEELRSKLLQSVLESHDTSKKEYDPIFYKLIVKNTLDNIQMPKANVNIEPILKIISDRFSGEIKNTSDKNSLKILFEYCINSFYEEANETFENAVSMFQKQLDSLKNDFYVMLYDDINTEYNTIIQQTNTKESQLNQYRITLMFLNRCLEMVA